VEQSRQLQSDTVHVVLFTSFSIFAPDMRVDEYIYRRYLRFMLSGSLGKSFNHQTILIGDVSLKLAKTRMAKSVDSSGPKE
jgi:hypothetical protein